MKHTATLTTMAAAALAAAIPLAAQAQTPAPAPAPAPSTLSIVIGPEPAIEPTVTCENPQPGNLIPFAYPGDHATRKGEVALFTTDVNESGKPTGVAVQASTGDAAGQEPGLTFGWTYGSSTATKCVQLKAQVPLETIESTITGQRIATSTSWATPTIATTGNGATSHVFMKSLATNANVVVSQTWDSGTNTLTVDIKKGSGGFLAARGSEVLTNLDITLQAPTGLRLKELATAATANIEWTCSTVAYSTTGN